nr:DUF6328 family protein [Cryobacterium sp. Hb1]
MDPRIGRDESTVERLDRNQGDTLQELRVTQTCTQIITGFFLLLTFQTRFTDPYHDLIIIYLNFYLGLGLSVAGVVQRLALSRAAQHALPSSRSGSFSREPTTRPVIESTVVSSRMWFVPDPIASQRRCSARWPRPGCSRKGDSN